MFINDICRCRTAQMGCNSETCACGYKLIHYNSCRNTSCPMCQRAKREEWVDRNNYYTLNVTYYHVVFTIPKSKMPACCQASISRFCRLIFRA